MRWRRDLDEAIRLDPEDGQAYRARGVSRALDGDYDAAMEDLIQAHRREA